MTTDSIRAAALLCCVATPALAQDDQAPLRTRVALGPQLVPSFPGADTVNIRPLVDVSRARGDADFAFEAADESFDVALIRGERFAAGPALGIEGRRTRERLGADIAEVGFSFEVGGFAQYQLAPALRLRMEARKGVSGHRGWIGSVGADYVARRGNDWLVSVGPRLGIADGRYQRAYFGVTPDDAARSGLTAFRPSGGLFSVGATAGLVRQLSERWGIYGYAKYDRLVDDAARSPVVRAFGSRNQLSGGVALTYTFGG